MGKIDALTAKYDAVAAELEDYLGDDVLEVLNEWAGGSLAVEYFGIDAGPLDALCLLRCWDRQMPYVLYSQVHQALNQGHSWNEVAAALGVSRQAATKRFIEFPADR